MKKKKEEQLGKCGISLCLNSEDDKWYIDNGCFHHMLGDSSIFFFLKRNESDHVAFEGDEPPTMLGKGKDNHRETKTNVDDIWLDEGLKHNILSMI